MSSYADTTPLVVTEVCYFLGTRAGAAAETAFLRSVAVGTFDLVNPLNLTAEGLNRRRGRQAARSAARPAG